MISVVFLFVLSVGYYLYTGQYQFVISLLAFYAIGRLFLFFIDSASLGKKKLLLYDLFFFIYGLLTLLSQMELIRDPFNDYFIHNDAAWSFYSWTMGDNFDAELGRLMAAEIKAPGSMSYFLGQVLFSKLAKFAIWFGITNIRLFLRMHVFALTSLIPPMMASIMSIYGVKRDVIVKNVILFSLCTYLFITSSIFTRDLHVCFLFTVAAYILLLPKCNFRSVLFIIVILLTYGFRQENGILLAIFMFGNYYVTFKKKGYGFVIAIMIITGVFVFASVFMSLIQDTLQNYNVAAINGNSATGLFMRFYSLPFPLNTIAMSIYMLLMPLPIGYYIVGQGNTWLTLPFVLSPYILIPVFLGGLWYLFKGAQDNRRLWVTLAVCFMSFFSITLGSPDLRRAYAAIPGMFMAYMIVRERIPSQWRKFVRKVAYPSIFVIVVALSLYVYTN